MRTGRTDVKAIILYRDTKLIRLKLFDIQYEPPEEQYLLVDLQNNIVKSTPKY